MSGFHDRAGPWWCDGVPIDDLVETYGTPRYVYSRDRVTANYRLVVDAFEALKAHVHYSVKANGNAAILRLLRDLGSGFDVVSGGELFRVLRVGADPATIVFAGVGKTEAELAYALKQRVGWINVESAQELAALERLAGALHQSQTVALRINPAIEAETHPHIATGGHRSKFGLDPDEARSILAQPDRFPHLDIAGLHVHIGSQLASPDRTVEAMRRVLELADGHPVRMLDVGGGFPVAYHPEETPPSPSAFAGALQPLLIGFERSTAIEIIVEPGRSIVADAGALIAEVQYIKQREGRRIVVVDASMTDLIRPALYAAYHQIVAIHRGRPIDVPTDIVGPVCESADVLGVDRALPELQRGDLVLILTTGAYGAAMASNYNSRPRAAEAMVEGSTHRLIRRRETWDDLVAPEEP